MPLHPVLEKMLQVVNRTQRFAAILPTAEELRLEIASQPVVPLEKRVQIFKIEDRTVLGPSGQIPIRIYTSEDKESLPLLMFFHGGGFVLGDLEGYDPLCRTLAKTSGHIVVSVGYRLAPEYPFPDAPEDCYAATQWVAEHAGELGGDAARLSVGGDSAGGCLSAVVCLMARDRKGPRIAKQVLIYPAVDFHDYGEVSKYPSYEVNAEGYFLTKGIMTAFSQYYLPQASERDNPYASPIRAESLQALPEALVLTMEYDPLRDEGEEFAQKLKEAGVAVTAKRYEGMIHALLAFPLSLTEIKDIYKQINLFLRGG